MTARWLAGAGAIAALLVAWSLLFWGATRLYETIEHAYIQWRRRRR